MPFTAILLTLYTLSLVLFLAGFFQKKNSLKQVSAVLFLAAVILTAAAGFSLKNM